MVEQVPLEAFFTHGDPRCGGDDDLNDDTSASSSALTPSTASSSSNNSGSIVYLHGPSHAGQTSLLLQYGFTHAKREQNVVLVICGGEDAAHPNKPVTVMISPCPKCGVPTQTGGDSLVWQRIQIKYLRNSNELQHFLCSFHMMKANCSMLLVDGLERFFGPDSFMGNVYQTLAYLYESLLFMQTSTGSGQVVVAGASDSFILQRTTRNALRRWCSLLEIREVKDCEFSLREEFEAPDNDEDVEDEDEDGEPEPKRIQLRYEYSSPDTRCDGVFRLLNVETALL